MLYINKVNYQTEEYTGQVLDKYMTYSNWPIKSTDNWIQNFILRESFFESEERYLGDGFFPREAQWFELYEDDTYNGPHRD